MGTTIAHRGPDDHGVWWDAESGVGFSHRRLSIVDLSQEGHQPMESACGRYVIAFNGEIYNFPDLRKDLESAGDVVWRGTSDTEVLLEAIAQWGVERTLEVCNGMFAFAVWDKRERVLHLARDRFGEKPLYYGIVNDCLVFGSELKALRAHPLFRPDVDRRSIALFMRYCYVPAPYSIYTDVYKLPAATFITFGAAGGAVDNARAQPRAYWSVQDTVQDSLKKPFEGTIEDALDELDRVLRKAVSIRMMADVPLGGFLSGGIDSSTIVALMQAQSERPVRTFSIGNEVDQYDEAPFAKKVAEHLGTEHTELYVSPSDTLAVIPKIPVTYDEPFADSSQVPTTLLSHLTRAQVTVSLSGDGGDELFAGYNRHFLGRRIWNRSRRLPRWLRRSCGSIIGSTSPSTVDRLYKLGSFAMPAKLRGQESPGRALGKIASILKADSAGAMYQALASTWQSPEELVLDTREPVSAVMNPDAWPALDDISHQMAYLDLITYLPDDILVKVDRASMSASLEARVPFLDPNVLELAWRFPVDWKVRQDEGKWILRQLLYRYVPKSLVERPKKGFGVPIGEWLRGPLRDWAEALIDPQKLAADGYLDVQTVGRCWQDHLEGSRFSPAKLWNVLMFQAWLGEQA